MSAGRRNEGALVLGRLTGSGRVARPAGRGRAVEVSGMGLTGVVLVRCRVADSRLWLWPVGRDASAVATGWPGCGHGLLGPAGEAARVARDGVAPTERRRPVALWWSRSARRGRRGRGATLNDRRPVARRRLWHDWRRLCLANMAWQRLVAAQPAAGARRSRLWSSMAAVAWPRTAMAWPRAGGASWPGGATRLVAALAQNGADSRAAATAVVWHGAV